ncbi:MAG: hypothetical protein ACMUHB_04245 [Thermoplasmatota archaeon]
MTDSTPNPTERCLHVTVHTLAPPHIGQAGVDDPEQGHGGERERREMCGGRP